MGRLCLAFGLGALRLLGFFTEPRLAEPEIHRVTGESARVERPAPSRPLSIVTWNIERGAAYDEILAALQRLDVDVAVLQEVDRGCRRSNYRDVARDLAHALGMNWIAAGEFQEIGEGRQGAAAITGQAILSRFRIDDPDVLRFTAQDRWRWSINPAQPRRGGRIALTARTAGLLVYNTHIESGGKNGIKRRQIAEILAHQSQPAHRNASVLIAGDFNNGSIILSPMLASFSAARFEDALGDAGSRGPTSLGQRQPIDWIFVRNVDSLSGRIVETPHASDHYPVIAALSHLTASGTR